jgi:hypothetical protein
MLSPITSPLFQMVLDVFGQTLATMINFLFAGSINITPATVAPTEIDIMEAVSAFVNLLNAYKGFLITTIPS